MFSRHEMFNRRVIEHEKTIVLYWGLDSALDTCDDIDIVEQMVEIENKLGLNFLKEAQSRVFEPRCYF